MGWGKGGWDIEEGKLGRKRRNSLISGFIMSLICKSQSISFHSFILQCILKIHYSNCIKLLICSHGYHIVDLFKC